MRDGLLERPENAGRPNDDARADPRRSPGAGTWRPSNSKGPPPMMYDFSLAVVLTFCFLALLAAVYVWSEDPGRRQRAWELIKLLFSR